MKINNNLNITNPVLHYKLDPGEPGLATPTRASQSIAKVATHEGTNIRRFKMEALRKGGVVIYSNIHLNLEYKGSFLAATSGKSNALIIIPGKERENVDINKNEDNKNNYFLTYEKIKDKSDVDKSNEKQSGKKESTNTNSNKDRIEQINDIIEKLKDEKLTLKGQLTDEKLINNKITDKKDEDVYRQNRLDDIEKKIQYLEQKKELEEQKQFLSNLVSTKNLSLKLVGLIYNNFNQNTGGILVDTII